MGKHLVEYTEAGEAVYEECSLEHLLNNVQILRQYGVVFMGSGQTTGYGKSTVARFLGAKFAVYMTGVLNRPKTEATVMNSTTLEDLSNLECKSGWAAVLDEFAVGDKEQCQYMSENILKTMADPQTTVGLRARKVNVRLASDSARIFTTNAKSLEEWANERFVVSEPIKRKMLVFVISKRLIERKWAERNDYVGSELF